jgi:hypothetical protein
VLTFRDVTAAPTVALVGKPLPFDCKAGPI